MKKQTDAFKEIYELGEGAHEDTSDSVLGYVIAVVAAITVTWLFLSAYLPFVLSHIKEVKP